MKKILLILPFVLLLSSCSGANSSSNEEKPYEPNIDLYNYEKTRYEFYPDEIKDVISSVLGENYIIPYVSAKSYEGQSFEYNAINVAYIEASGVYNSSGALSNYKTSLENLNFITYDYDEDYGYSAYLTIDENEAIVVQYNYYKGISEDSFKIYAYINEINTSYSLFWPTSQIKEVLGEDIPSFDADYYEFIKSTDITNSYYVAEIYCYKESMTEDDFNEYTNILIENNYILTKDMENTLKTYFNESNNITITVNLSNYGNNYLQINAYKAN